MAEIVQEMTEKEAELARQQGRQRGGESKTIIPSRTFKGRNNRTHSCNEKKVFADVARAAMTRKFEKCDPSALVVVSLCLDLQGS